MSEKSAQDRVKEWLHKSGYPLELQVAAVLQSKDFSVTPSFIYTDDESGKNREIDIVATKSDRMGFSHAGFVIECKSTPNPWVVFRAKDSSTFASSLVGLTLHTDTADPAMERLRSKPSNVKWRLERREVGYGLREASSGQNDSAYSVCTSLFKASRAWLSSARVASPRVAFAFPVLVVSSPIFECSLDEKHELVLEEVHESSFVFSPPAVGQSPCMIRVVNKSLLKHFSEYAAALAQDVHLELEHEFNVWRESLRRPRT